MYGILYRKRYSIALLILGMYSLILLTLLRIVNMSISERHECPTCPQRCARGQSSLERNGLTMVEVFTKENNGQQEVEKISVEDNALQEMGENLSKVVEQSYTNVINETGSMKVPDNGNEKIDWNDYGFIARDSKRVGHGEQGEPLTSSLFNKDSEKNAKLREKYNFNTYLSDHISFERSIGDLRTPACKKQQFIKNIPENSVSFIIVFHNEKNSTILRTIHSIINRSPAKLVKEIILVDDLSIDEEVMGPLEQYIAKHFTKVRIFRNKERLGLIKSRMAGADQCNGNFLVFFDAHVEVNHNYLPPLLEPMILDYRTISCPMVDFVNADTMKVSPLNNRVRGGFNWQLGYIRLPAFANDETTPHASPVMVGCAFAITRKWWEEIGRYDPGLEIWGGEQYEISFKSWQCGGSVVDAPCSRVAHLFRPLPYVKEVTGDDLIDKNLLRVASVWMDEYKEFVLRRRPAMKRVNAGDITQQLDLRKRLACKSFKWFMEEIAPDIIKYYPLIEPPAMAWGKLKSNANSSQCIIISNRNTALGNCDAHPKVTFAFNWRLHIWQGGTEDCLTHTGGKHIFMWNCIDIEEKNTQNFVWNRQNGHLVSTSTNLCVDADLSSLAVFAQACIDNSTTQSWTFEAYNSTLVDEVWKNYVNTLV